MHTKPARPIEIVYEDDCLRVVNKPAGLLVVPTPKKETYTLTSILNQQFKNQENIAHLYPCHRLDRDTSGLIIYAKGKKNQDLMMQQFKLRRVKKKYIALLHGRLKNDSGTIKSFIEDIPIGAKRHFHNRALAITEYKVLEKRKGYSIVEVRPITGRTNQIRIHFQRMGNPLLGERKYAFARDYPLKFKRVVLHATGLEFSHPVTGKRINLDLALPEDIANFIKNN